MIKPAAFLFILLALAITGCSMDDPVVPPPIPLPPSTQGSWHGTVPALMNVDLVLAETRGVVTGSSVLSPLSGGGETQGYIRGSTAYPYTKMTISMSGYQAITFTAMFVSPDVIAGDLYGSGFNHLPITLSRQIPTE